MEIRSPGVATIIGLAAQVGLVRFESAGASTLHFSFNPGDATGTQEIGVRSAEVC